MLEKQTVISQQRRMRILNEASYIILTSCTTREAAKEFNLSKSTIHKDMRKALPTINKQMALKVDAVLKYNDSIKHLRGGEVTRDRYSKKLPRRDVIE